jgi:hypothetical protein
MNRLYDAAHLLVSSWALTKQDSNDTKIPTSEGLLDRAMKISVEAGNFPDWFRSSLHFVDSRMGLQCVELPTILDWAQRGKLTNAPNPTYQSTEVQLSDLVARKLIHRLEIPEADARKWGAAFRQALIQAEKDSRTEDPELEAVLG